MNNNLNNKVAIVTGASRGIGLAIASKLSDLGVKLALCSRNEKELELSTKQFKTEHLIKKCDVTSWDEIKKFTESAYSKFKRIDILVNNAGDPTSIPIHKMTKDEWDRMIAVNLSSVFSMTSIVLSTMRTSGYGRIVNVASIVGKIGGRYISAYSAAKHGVLGFTRSLAIELEGSGITINSVCPGFVDTPATTQNIEKIIQKTGMKKEDVIKFMVAENKSGKMITPLEVAQLVIQLILSDKNGESIDIT